METITSRKNPQAVHMRKLGASRSYREERGEFVCDGKKLLADALSSGAEVTAILTSARLTSPLPIDIRVYYARQDIIDSVSQLTNAQDTLFVCKTPPATAPADISGTCILLDGVQDPGNVGAMIRSADAFGISAVFLTGNCADPFGPKSARASMGAVFRQRIFTASLQELEGYKGRGASFVGAALLGESLDIRDVTLDNTIIAIGSEGQGISEEVMSLCGMTVRIPVAPACDSLNAAVAASIIMWEATRSQRTASGLLGGTPR